MRLCTVAGSLALAVLLGACTETPAPTATDPAASDQPTTAADVLPGCGYEDFDACVLPPRCDRGLQVDGRGTIRVDDDTCVNHTRHWAGASFRGTWMDWALGNQRTLAIDEPINWVQHLSTHNANNNLADGETFDPNQIWSMSDQLDLGSRFLWLDLHWVAGQVRLCHGADFAIGKVGPELHPGCGPGDRPFAYAVREIAEWLEDNPDEIVMMDLEAYVEGHDVEVADALSAFLGTLLFKDTDRIDRERWPTRRELLDMNKRAIVVAEGVNFRGINHPEYIPNRGEFRFVGNLRSTRSAANAGVVTRCVSVVGADSLELTAANTQFRVVGEDRTRFGELFVGSGYMDPSDISTLAACNVPLQSLDELSPYIRGAPSAFIDRLIELENTGRLPGPDTLQRYLVWSWAENDRGGNGDAALLRGSSGRWSSASTDEIHRFACARERTETRTPGPGLAAWTNLLGNAWRVTTRAGRWHEGARACLEEFGADGFVYSVPRNGFMNGRLRLADATNGTVWLSYNQVDDEGSWIITRRPTAAAGADRTVECEDGHHGALVQLDAGASLDPDDDALTYEWRGSFGTATGVRPSVTLPLGTHEIVLIADDRRGGADADTVMITVVDTKPPVIHAARATPSALWPPNHKMVPVAMTVDVTDACDDAPRCRIVGVTSNEPANGGGDGNTSPDWRIVSPLVVELRGERSGQGDGRVYTITIECADSSGNSARTQVAVPVAHDQGRP